MRLNRDWPLMAPWGGGGVFINLLSREASLFSAVLFCPCSRVRLRGCSVGSSTLAAYNTLRIGHRYSCGHRALMTITKPFHRKLGEPLSLGPDYPQSNGLLLTCVLRSWCSVVLRAQPNLLDVCQCVRLCDSELRGEMKEDERPGASLRNLPHTFLSLI